MAERWPTVDDICIYQMRATKLDRVTGNARSPGRTPLDVYTKRGSEWVRSGDAVDKAKKDVQ